MAVKASKNKKIKTEIKTEIAPETVAETKKNGCVCKSGKWISAGWVLLLFGGLAHMLPEQMAPILKWSLFGVSLQMAVGVLSVIIALNFLLED